LVIKKTTEGGGQKSCGGNHRFIKLDQIRRKKKFRGVVAGS